MTSSELNPFIYKSLTSFVEYCRSNPASFMQDTIRGGKERVETLAAFLFAENHLPSKSPTSSTALAHQLLAYRTAELLWPERAYSASDEDIAYWGTVPSSFAIIALSKELSSNSNPEILSELIKSCDVLYQQEQNGYFRKAGINRSDVHNTNLLAGYALLVASKLLPPESVRARMYRESAKRATLKVMMHQSFGGFFPYHQKTIACPILYQAMVTAILNLLIPYFSDGVLLKSYHVGLRALRSFYGSSGAIDWNIANHHDKRGSTWAYSFTLCALPLNDPLIIPVQQKLESLRERLFQGVEGDQSTKNDIFFNAWIVFGLAWNSEKNELPVLPSSLRLQLRWLLLKLHFIFGFFSYITAYAKNKYLNFLFESGALENRKWGG